MTAAARVSSQTNHDTRKIVYLMHGLPSCGKNHTAKRLAGDDGMVFETNELFHTQVGEDPARFDFRSDLMPQARQWNL